MMNYYIVYYTTKLNGETIHSHSGRAMNEPDKMTEEHITITWESLKDFYHRWGLVAGFNVWNAKKGQQISLFGKVFSDRKEWKHPETGLTFHVTYREYEPSIQTILDWGEQAKAIQYLNERNLKIGG